MKYSTLNQIKTNGIRQSWILLLLLTVASLPGAQQADGRDTPESLWKKEIIQQRASKDREFKTDPVSPMAGVKRLTFDSHIGQSLFVSIENEQITITKKAPQITRFELQETDEGWTWQAKAPHVFCKIGEELVTPGTPFTAGTQIHDELYTFSLYPAPKQLTVIIFYSRSKQIQHFSKLLYFPPDPKYAVNAVLEKFPETEPKTFTTSRNLKKTFYKYARIKFKLDGRDLQLTAFRFGLEDTPENRVLFIPFADATNGEETYETGRFLEIPEPQTPSFNLDFNLCYNPLCNYSDVYNCPLPPPDNILDVKINAGEKTYPH